MAGLLDYEFTCEDLRKVSSARKPISKWFTATQVGTHNSVNDCWVTISGRVYEITPLFASNPPLLFKISQYYTPQGRFAHIPPPLPRTDFNMDYNPWWKDPKWVIGYLSKRTQWIRLKNILLDQVYTMEVPSEETINEILYRYSEHNKHAGSYEWKAILEYGPNKFITLDMDKTLTENGVKDESEDFGRAGMELDYLLPVLHLHYTDDLTVA